jgi:hypothetical protein
MTDTDSQREEFTRVSQTGSANKLTQVGRDYIRNIQFNITTGNWLGVALLVVLPVLFLCAGVKTVEYVSHEVMSTLNRPGDSKLRQQLQSQLPPFWEVTTFEIKEEQNTGTQVEPSINTRFHAVARLKEDTFSDAGKINSVELARQQGVTFVRPSEKQGKTVDLFGISTSHLVSEEWKAVFRFNENPTLNLGTPRSSFGSRTIIVDSKEEQDFVAEVRTQIEAEKQNLISKVANGETLIGIETESSGTYPFKLHFSSFNKATGRWSGEIEWTTLQAIHKVEGTLSDITLTFKEVEFIKKGNAVLGADYSVSLDPQSKGKRLVGEWRNVVDLPLQGLFPMGGDFADVGKVQIDL